MTSFDKFMPFILPYVQGCPTPTAYQALNSAAREFCERSHILQHTYRVTAVAGQDLYALESAPQQTAVSLLYAGYGAKPLNIAAAAHVTDPDALVGVDGLSDLPEGTPTTALLRDTDPCSVAVWPVPVDPLDERGFVFKVALAPTRAATYLPDVLFNNWVDEISFGAVANLQAIPGQPFSADPTYAAVMFARGVSKAKAEARRGRLVTSMRVNGPSFV